MHYIYEYSPIAGLLFFFCVFALIALKVCTPGAAQKLQTHAQIPLQGD